MNTEPMLGAIQSSHDYRDHVASAMVASIAPLAALPPTFDTKFPGPILDQSKEPACVSHSVAQLLQLYHFEHTGQFVDFSPRFLDILAKRTDGQGLNDGTFPRLVFQLAVKYGCATTAALPNDTSLPIAQYRDDAMLTPAVFADAAKYKIPGYLSVPVDFNSWRNATYLYGGVSMLMQVNNSWWTATDGTNSWAPSAIDPLRTPSPAAPVTGGHQIIQTGWISPTIDTLRNSWGADWDVNGEGHYNFAAWSPFILEGWVIADLPSDLSDFLHNLPASTAFHYAWNTDMALGQSSEDIKWMQVGLMILGYLGYVDPTALGTYGPMTVAAVNRFQIANRISPTAPKNFGPKSRAALNKLFAI